MAIPQEHISMALFCDFENVALGVRDANYDKFDIKRVLERLLLKGSIVVKKAYCDWERYKGFKAAMHEANFELIEIPHVRQSGKNSADIRLVVDALDLCYTKSHVNTFVVISGDSDFSPLVSKLRENAKYVIGVGVKNSTSDLLIANCDEFIFYDDLVRESQRQAARRDTRDNRDQQQARRSPEEERRRREEMEVRRAKVIEMAAETYEALVTDRDEGGRIWASVLKEALKRRNPGFSEQYYGFRTFGNLLEEAQQRGLLEFGRDEKSGAYVYRGSGIPTARAEPLPSSAPMHDARAMAYEASPSDANNIAASTGDNHANDRHPSGAQPASGRAPSGRGRQRGGRRSSGKHADEAVAPAAQAAPLAPPAPPVSAEVAQETPAAPPAAAEQAATKGRRGNRRPTAAKSTQSAPVATAAPSSAPTPAPEPSPAPAPAAKTPLAAAKKAPVRRRPARKTAAKATPSE